MHVGYFVGYPVNPEIARHLILPAFLACLYPITTFHHSHAPPQRITISPMRASEILGMGGVEKLGDENQ